MKTLRTILLNSVLVVISLGMSLGLLELGLRVGGYQMREARVLCLDALVGNVYCPGVRAPIDDQRGGFLSIAINSEGMADREYARAKPAHTTRIALLGDSVTASLYTPAKDKFKSLWEEGLNGVQQNRIEILNFAVDGQGTWDELQLFHQKGRHFQPDYVILAFFWGNDVWNNTALRDKGRPNPIKDEYPNPTGVRELQVKHRSLIRWLWNHSAAFQWLDTLKDTAEQTRSYQAGTKVVHPSDPGASPIVYDVSFDWDSDAWQLTRELILKLKRESANAGARLIVFDFPALDQVEKPKPLPYRRFHDFLASHDIPNLDVFDVLYKLPSEDREKLYITDRVHLTAEGHRIFAEATLPKLQTLIAPEKPHTLRTGS